MGKGKGKQKMEAEKVEVEMVKRFQNIRTCLPSPSRTALS